MGKKILVASIIFVIVFAGIVAICLYKKEPPAPREVELELINPVTGEVVKNGDRVQLPEEKTYIEVRIKDKETGEYLTDEDLPKKVKGSYSICIEIYDDTWEKAKGPVLEGGYWPKEVDAIYDHYEITIFFDKNRSQEKYRLKTGVEYIRIILFK